MPQPHYYSEKQASPMHTSKIKVLLRGISFEFYTAPGVFSKKKIDNGLAGKPSKKCDFDSSKKYILDRCIGASSKSGLMTEGTLLQKFRLWHMQDFQTMKAVVSIPANKQRGLTD